MGYNGYTNYPTWAVMLWNAEDVYEAADERFQEDPLIDKHDLADYLKDWFGDFDHGMPIGDCSMGGDLAGWVLDQIDWVDIADTVLIDLRADHEAAIES